MNEKTSSYSPLVPNFVNLVASVEVIRMLSMNLPKSNLPAFLWWMRVSAKSVLTQKSHVPGRHFNPNITLQDWQLVTVAGKENFAAQCPVGKVVVGQYQLMIVCPILVKVCLFELVIKRSREAHL